MTLLLRARAILLVITVTMPTLASPATVVGTGTRGDFHEEVRCPAGEFLVGLYGRTGAWIDQVGPICARFSQPSYTAGEQTRAPARGGNGGGPNEQSCESDSAIRSAAIELVDSGDQVGNIKFSCLRPIDGSFGGGKIFGGTASTYRSLDWYNLPQECTGSEYAIGLNLYYGKHVNGVGLICGEFTAAPATMQLPNIGAVVGSTANAPKPSGKFTGVVPATKMAAVGKTDPVSHSVTSTVGSGAIAKVAPPVSGGAPPASLTTGTFDTSFGALDLGADSGTYTVSQGRVSVQSTHDNIVEGVWEQSSAAKQCPDGRYWGKFVFAFSAKGFTGFYGYCDDAPTAGEWNGTRR
jgi:hypothetical protein